MKFIDFEEGKRVTTVSEDDRKIVVNNDDEDVLTWHKFDQNKNGD